MDKWGIFKVHFLSCINIKLSSRPKSKVKAQRLLSLKDTNTLVVGTETGAREEVFTVKRWWGWWRSYAAWDERRPLHLCEPVHGDSIRSVGEFGTHEAWNSLFRNKLRENIATHTSNTERRGSSNAIPFSPPHSPYKGSSTCMIWHRQEEKMTSRQLSKTFFF